VRIQSITTGGYVDYKGFFIERWLFRAFDRYVLENADLESELALSQQRAEEFVACADTLPALDVADPGSYYTGLQQCVKDIDPTLLQN
jgi:hypothetical protein